jgi:hypothetical protein
LTPTARTLEYLRRSHYLPDVVERWLPRINRRRDFLGFADILAVRPGDPGVLAIQATTRGHVSDRLARARSRPELVTWLRSGNRFEVWGWYQVADRWRVHRVEVRPQDLAAVPLQAPRRRQKQHQAELFE